MGCLIKTTKIFLVLFNLILATIGITIIVFGVNFKKYTQHAISEIGLNATPDASNDIVITVNGLGIGTIVIGSILLITAIIGIVGVLSRNRCALFCYSTIMIVLTLIIAAIGGLTFYVSKKMDVGQLNVTSEQVSKILNDYNWNDSENPTTKRVDELQLYWSCCGVWNYTDWDTFRPGNVDTDKYPNSCCPKADDKVTCSINTENFRKNGCAKEVASAVKNYIKITSFAFLAIAGLQLFIIVLSYVLMYSKEDEKYGSGHVIATNPKISQTRAETYAYVRGHNVY